LAVTSILRGAACALVGHVGKRPATTIPTSIPRLIMLALMTSPLDLRRQSEWRNQASRRGLDRLYRLHSRYPASPWLLVIPALADCHDLALAIRRACLRGYRLNLRSCKAIFQINAGLFLK